MSSVYYAVMLSALIINEIFIKGGGGGGEENKLVSHPTTIHCRESIGSNNKICFFFVFISHGHQHLQIILH